VNWPAGLAGLTMSSPGITNGWAHRGGAALLTATGGSAGFSGSTDYVLCMRQDFHDRIVESSRLAGRNWRRTCPSPYAQTIAPSPANFCKWSDAADCAWPFARDTWVESAQLALYGDFATILPSIALRVNPELVPFTLEGMPLPSERVLMVLNPSILPRAGPPADAQRNDHGILGCVDLGGCACTLR